MAAAFSRAIRINKLVLSLSGEKVNVPAGDMTADGAGSLFFLTRLGFSFALSFSSLLEGPDSGTTAEAGPNTPVALGSVRTPTGSINGSTGDPSAGDVDFEWDDDAMDMLPGGMLPPTEEEMEYAGNGAFGIVNGVA